MYSLDTKDKHLRAQRVYQAFAQGGMFMWALWNGKHPWGDKFNKAPLNESGKPIGTCIPVQTALETLKEQPRQFDGIGIRLNDTPFTLIDLDNVRNPDTGNLSNDANLILKWTNPAYAEFSTSGRGLHIVVRGKMPPEYGHKANLPDGSRIEVYDRHFMAATGHIYKDRDNPNYRPQAAIDAICEQYLPTKKEPDTKRTYTNSVNTQGRAYTGQSFTNSVNTRRDTDTDALRQNTDTALTDSRIIELLRSSSERWRKMFDTGRDIEEHNRRDKSQSGADFALAVKVAFYTKEAAQIKRIMRRSAWQREKWSRSDYLTRTITKAIQAQTETYTGRPQGTRKDIKQAKDIAERWQPPDRRGHTAKHLWLTMLRLANKANTANPQISNRQLADKAGITRPTVSRALAYLIDLGAVRLHQKGAGTDANTYGLANPQIDNPGQSFTNSVNTSPYPLGTIGKRMTGVKTAFFYGALNLSGQRALSALIKAESPATVTDVCKATGCSQRTVRRLCKKLKGWDVVKREKQGRFVYLSLTPNWQANLKDYAVNSKTFTKDLEREIRNKQQQAGNCNYYACKEREKGNEAAARRFDKEQAGYRERIEVLEKKLAEKQRYKQQKARQKQLAALLHQRKKQLAGHLQRAGRPHPCTFNRKKFSYTKKVNHAIHA